MYGQLRQCLDFIATSVWRNAQVKTCVHVRVCVCVCVCMCVAACVFVLSCRQELLTVLRSCAWASGKCIIIYKLFTYMCLCVCVCTRSGPQCLTVNETAKLILIQLEDLTVLARILLQTVLRACCFLCAHCVLVQRKYDLLCILDFDNVRKRMSVGRCSRTVCISASIRWPCLCVWGGGGQSNPCIDRSHIMWYFDNSLLYGHLHEG